ncbi:MAG: glycosyltransferase family 4 protein [Pyrinomonadaceae bacterium]
MRAFFFKHNPYLPDDCKAHSGDLADCMRLIKEGGFDVVHTNNPDWRKGIAAIRGIGAKVVATSHGSIQAGDWTYGWNSSNCDGFVACSNWIAKELQDYTDLPIKVIFNGVDTNNFRPSEQNHGTPSPIVAWVGRANDLTEKQVDRFAAIAPLLHEAGLRLWVVSTQGPEELTRIGPEVARTLLASTEFWGMVPLEEMPKMYQEVATSGGCVVSTSSSEGLPLALLEAQACGCPVIGPDVRGINECVDPQHGGLLYSPQIKAEQLAKLILNTLHDTKEMQWRRTACADHVRTRFSLERMIQEYLLFYREAPYSPRAGFLNRVNKRFRLSPFNWKDYVEHRWKVGCYQYHSSQELAANGEWNLASVAARAAINN